MLTQPTSLDMLQNCNSKQFMCVPTNNTSKQVFHPPFTVLKTETQRSDSAEVTQPENGNAGIDQMQIMTKTNTLGPTG